MSPSAKNTRRSARRAAAAAACVLASAALSADAFAPSSVPVPVVVVSSPSSRRTALFAASPPEQGRREMLSKSFGAALGLLSTGAVVGGVPEEASATYSAYTAREKDWEERKETGDIRVSSARDLRAQLRDIVPQNSEGSKVFCPNGPSSAVSPLMENKCNDQLAMPSVYGRTADAAGNSVPGFNGGKYGPVGGGSIAVGSGVAAIGGFPTYKPY